MACRGGGGGQLDEGGEGRSYLDWRDLTRSWISLWTKKCDPAHATGGAACSLTTSVTLPMRLMLAVCMLL